MTSGDAQRFGHSGRSAAAVAATLAVAVLGAAAAVTVARAASEPIVHVYDVRVTGVLRTTKSLPSKPLLLDLAWSETSAWRETYKGVRLNVKTPEYDPEQAPAMRIEGTEGTEGTITGSIRYGSSGPHVRSCGWKTSRPEPGSLYLSGTAASGYELHLSTGRRSAGVSPLRGTNCPGWEDLKWAKFTGARLGPGGGIAAGWVDTRTVRLDVEFRTPQQTGQLGFPLNRLSAGAGFVLNVKGKTMKGSIRYGRWVSEGTARITFVPRPS